MIRGPPRPSSCINNALDQPRNPASGRRFALLSLLNSYYIFHRPTLDGMYLGKGVHLFSPYTLYHFIKRNGIIVTKVTSWKN